MIFRQRLKFSPEGTSGGGAAMSPEQMRETFEGPLGLMLGKLGVLSQEQQGVSGEKQALMVVVRNAIQDGRLSTGDIPQFNGEPDLLAFANMEESDLQAILEKGNITETELGAAKELVNSYKGVNTEGDTLDVPFMGQIHAKLHANQETIQAALAMQQAVRASDVAARLQGGQTDPSLHAKKREFNASNSKDDGRTTILVALHHCMSEYEAEMDADSTHELDAEIMIELDDAFKIAKKMFEDAGQPDLAKQVSTVWTQNRVLLGYEGGAPVVVTDPEPET